MPGKEIKDAAAPDPRHDERELCAAYVRTRARAASQLLAQGRTSADTADHVGRVVALVADELLAGFHLPGAGK